MPETVDISEEYIEQEARSGVEAGRQLFLTHLRQYLKPVDGNISQIQFESMIYGIADLYFQFVNDTAPDCYESAKYRISQLISGHELD